MKKKPIDKINSDVVLDKYLLNKLPTRREIYQWLIDIPYIVASEKEVCEDLQSFACFYLDTAGPFIDKALEQKYGFKDAIHFINYNVINTIRKDKELEVEMDRVIKLEQENFEEVLKFFKKQGHFH